MNKLPIKPMSINEAWQGRRFKTPKYKKWRDDVVKILPAMKQIPEGKKMLLVTFGLSSKNADFDNPLKCFVDCLQEKYKFNDREIYVGMVAKVDVKKGCEFIKWDMQPMPERMCCECWLNSSDNSPVCKCEE